jgi:hypothetical protein
MSGAGEPTQNASAHLLPGSSGVHGRLGEVDLPVFAGASTPSITQQ